MKPQGLVCGCNKLRKNEGIVNLHISVSVLDVMHTDGRCIYLGDILNFEMGLSQMWHLYELMNTRSMWHMAKWCHSTVCQQFLCIVFLREISVQERHISRNKVMPFEALMLAVVNVESNIQRGFGQDAQNI